MYRFRWIILLGVMVFSCTSHTVTVSELQEYIQQPEHGLAQAVEDQEHQVSMTYKPIDIVITQHYKDDIRQGFIDIDSIRKELSQYIFFTLRISYRKQEIEQKYVANSGAYQQAVQYISSELAKDIYLKILYKDKSLPVTDYAYVHTYGMTEASSVLIAFQRSDIVDEEHFTIQVEGSKLGFNIPPFSFQTKNIEQIPHIDFKNTGYDRNI